jgi:hypothetical protein
LLRVPLVDASADSDRSNGGTEIISTSSFWLDWTSPSKSEARRFNGDDDLCGRSAAPPIITRCENKCTGD